VALCYDESVITQNQICAAGDAQTDASILLEDVISNHCS